MKNILIILFLFFNISAFSGTLTCNTADYRYDVVDYSIRYLKKAIGSTPEVDGLPLLTNSVRVGSYLTRFERNTNNPFNVYKGITGIAVSGTGAQHIVNGTLIGPRLIIAQSHWNSPPDALANITWTFVGLNNGADTGVEEWNAVSIRSFEITNATGTRIDNALLMVDQEAPSYIEVVPFTAPDLLSKLSPGGRSIPILAKHAIQQIQNDNAGTVASDPASDPLFSLYGQLSLQSVYNGGGGYLGINWGFRKYGFDNPRNQWITPIMAEYSLAIVGGDSGSGAFFAIGDQLVFSGINAANTFATLDIINTLAAEMYSKEGVPYTDDQEPQPFSLSAFR